MDFLRNYFVVLLALILVFVLNVSFTLGDYNIEANYDFDDFKVLKARDAKLQLECNVTSTQPSSNNPSIKWLKNDKQIASSDLVDISGGKLTVRRPSWNDVGNYTCEVYNPATPAKKEGWAHIHVIAKPYVKIHPNELISIEGEELKIECLVYGRPTPRVYWLIDNGTRYDDSHDRVSISTESVDENMMKAYFKIEHSKMSDRGSYACVATLDANLSDPADKDPSKATCYVRIKEKYAALWPFLGICVEVVVLCAVIFIYEKKRNKAELEESDTDQSPEQHKK